MRLAPLAAAFLLLYAAPHAQAGASSVSLDAPASVAAARATTVPLGVTLLLDGVVCTSAAEVPVSLRVLEASGLRTAQLSLEEISFSVGPTEAAASEWRGHAEVPLTLWASAASGFVRVGATYALPSQCLVAGGASSGSASVTLRVEGATLPPAPEQARAAAAPPGASAGAEHADEPALPLPVAGAIAATAFGAFVVLLKRVRAVRA